MTSQTCCAKGGAIFYFIIFLIALGLSACGGGGGSGASSASTSFGTKQMGVAGKSTQGQSTATDANGNVYVTGTTNGDLDGNTLTGTIDFFLTKYNAAGTRLYTKQMGVAGASTWSRSTTTDASGNVYVSGFTNGNLDGNTLTGGDDFFLTKYNAAGTKLYTKQMGVTGGMTTWSFSIATDTSGNVYVAGFTNGGLDGNTGTGVTDFFLTKYNATGTKLYTRQLGVAGAGTSGYSTATDANGNVYVTGTTTGNLDGNTLMGSMDFFLTKYNAAGIKLYTRQMGVAGVATWGYSTATDVSGNVYVTGITQGSLDGNTLTGTEDFFLTKYNSAGTKLYTRQLGVAGATTWGTSTTTDANGNVYVTGITNGGLDGNTLAGTYDFFLTKYNSAGTKLYTKQMGTTGANTRGYSTATDANSNVYVAGFTNGGLDGNTLVGTNDFFLIKYNSAGTKQ